MTNILPQVYFLAPDPDEFPSGGNQYNAALSTALKKLGIPASIGSDIPGTASHVIVDSLYLDRWDPSGKEYLLVHYLSGMESGQSRGIPSAEKWRGAIVTGDQTRDLLLANGWSPEKVVLLYPGLPGISLAESTPCNHLSILWVGNLIPGKGILAFLNSLLPFYDTLKDVGVSIQLAGSDQLDHIYAKRCLQGMDKLASVVEYKGSLSYQRMLEAFQKANLFLSTSHFETFGMAILEARAAGLPVIALRDGIGPHKTSALIAFEKEEEIIEYLIRLAKNPTLVQELKERSISDRTQLIHQFPDWDKQAERLADFISIR